MAISEPDAGGADGADPFPEETFHLVLALGSVAPSIARDLVRRWLLAHRWSPVNIDDLVLAISELVTNSIEHGYGIVAGKRDSCAVHQSAVRLDGRVVTDEDGRRTEFTISDHGHWTPPPRVKGSRGHGLTIVRACAEEVRIDGGATGTTVFLRSHPVPPVRADTQA